MSGNDRSVSQSYVIHTSSYVKSARRLDKASHFTGNVDIQLCVFAARVLSFLTTWRRLPRRCTDSACVCGCTRTHVVSSDFTVPSCSIWLPSIRDGAVSQMCVDLLSSDCIAAPILPANARVKIVHGSEATVCRIQCRVSSN